MRDMVFFSHANPEDNEVTRWLALQLARAGYAVWCDLTISRACRIGPLDRPADAQVRYSGASAGMWAERELSFPVTS